MNNPKLGICTYCGNKRALTVDHIPPKSLFGKPRPNDLITVPCCLACNNAASKDDEYFRTVLVLKQRAGDHPDALAIRPSVMRGLQKANKRGFTRALLQRMKAISVRTPAGLYLGKGMTYNVDLARLDRVVERITRGLYFRHRGERVPPDYEVSSAAEEGFANLTQTDLRRIQTEIIGPTLRASPIVVGRGVMKYWLAWAEDAPIVSSWIFEFYGDVRFAAIILPSGPSA